MSEPLLIATTNEGKIKELNLLFSKLQGRYSLLTLRDFSIAEPDEPYETYTENAEHKAYYYGHQSSMWVLCDDSGFGVDCLNGFPGVRTKDFYQECGSLKESFAKLENLLQNEDHKRAQFTTALSLYNPYTKTVKTVIESEAGNLCFPSRGTQGFGYDPIFIPEGYTKTMAELGDQVKCQIGHRAKAFELLFKDDLTCF